MSHAMNNAKKQNQASNGVGSRELVSCIWHLGPRKGLRYWRIARLCARVPNFALQWADCLDSEALSHEATGVTQYAPHLRAFASDLRRHHAAWIAANVEMSHARERESQP